MILSASQKREIENLAKKFGLRFVVLFGSQVTGLANKESDYDIALMSKTSRQFYESLKEYSDILDGLGGILNLPEEKLDLTDLRNEDILLRYQIVSASQLLFGDPLDYETFKSFAIREYQGAGALFALESAIINRRQKLLQS